VPFSVNDFLALPVLADARPEVAAGLTLGERPVRWVHSSEIYDISPLLKGGEVLLTTGLGLVAVSADARRTYIAALARLGVAALVLELGRTFATVPVELVDEAERAGLPLILLHGVVPFIEITEAAHTRILGRELEQLRAGAALRDRLVLALSHSRGIAAFAGAIAEMAGCPVAVYSADGHLVAGTAADTAGPAGTPSEVVATITVLGEHWGRLVLRPPGDHGEAEHNRLGVLAGAASPLVALEITRSGGTPASRSQAGAELLRDMVTGRYESTADLSARALGVGMLVRPGQKALAICVRTRSSSAASTGTSVTSVLIAARAVATRLYGTALIAEYDNDVLLGVITRPRELRATLETFADELGRELRSTLGVGVIVSAAAAVDDVTALVGAFPSARDTARMALRLTPSATVVLSADFALYQLLVSLVEDEVLERFVTAQLGALLTHDARTGAGLVMTLDAYLAAGMSKTRTAETLGIRRQTLYGRLERIATLLGGLDLDNRERRTALDLALVSWRLRLSATRSR